MRMRFEPPVPSAVTAPSASVSGLPPGLAGVVVDRMPTPGATMSPPGWEESPRPPVESPDSTTSSGEGLPDDSEKQQTEIVLRRLGDGGHLAISR
mgnify:CR=1 FL=1